MTFWAEKKCIRSVARLVNNVVIDDYNDCPPRGCFFHCTDICLSNAVKLFLKAVQTVCFHILCFVCVSECDLERS